MSCTADGRSKRAGTARALATVLFLVGAARTLAQKPMGPVDAAVTGAAAGGPANDDCASAIAVGDGTVLFSTSGATTDGPDEGAICNENNYTNVNADIWYLYSKAPCTGELRVSLCGSSYDTKLAIYPGTRCPTSASAIACNDDACDETEQSEVTVPVNQGNTFLIRVGGFFNSQGDGTMTITCVPDTVSNGSCCADGACLGTTTQPVCDFLGGAWFVGTTCPPFICPPVNDECDNAMPLDTEVPFAGTTEGAEGTDISSCAPNDRRDVWHVWTADCVGEAVFRLCGGDPAFDTTLAIYTACDGQELACNDDECGQQSRIALRVEPGETYYIRVAGFQAAVGDYTLTVESCASACCSQLGFCALRKPDVCTSQNGIPQAPGSVCLGDSNFNGRDDICEPDPWLFKDFNASDPGGYLPDFDQQQDFDNLDGDNNARTGVDGFYGGPTAAANSLWWFHRRYPSAGVVPAGYTPHDLVADLAERMDTRSAPAPVGTAPENFEAGLDAYLGDNGLNALFGRHSEAAPPLDFVVDEVTRSQDVILLLGFYHVESVDTIPSTGYVVHWRRTGGTYTTVAGVDATNERVALSDPDGDFVEETLPGFVRGGDHDHDGDADPGTFFVFRDANYNHTRHDDEDLASHDVYFAMPSFSPNAQFVIGPSRNPFLYAILQSDFHDDDSGGAFDAGTTFVTIAFLTANNYPIPQPCQTYTVAERAIVISPLEAQACCSPTFACTSVRPVECLAQGGEPQGFGTSCLGDGNGNTLDDFCEPCPAATIAPAGPPSGAVDARQPFAPASPTPRQGIGSPGAAGSAAEPIVVALNPAITNAGRCFRLCETRTDPLEGPNSIAQVTSLGGGGYQIALDHAITAGGTTTIRYRGGGSFVTYRAHPGNVDGNTVANLTDVQKMIDCCLKQTCAVPWGLLSCDLDHSGIVAALDLVRLGDLFNGAQDYSVWLNTGLPGNLSCP